MFFVNNVEGDVLGDDGILVAWPVEQEGDDVVRFHAIIALDGLVVHVDETRTCRHLDAVARGIGQVVQEEFVHTQELLSLVGHNAKMLVEPALAFFVFVLFGQGVVGQGFSNGILGLQRTERCCGHRQGFRLVNNCTRR